MEGGGTTIEEPLEEEPAAEELPTEEPVAEAPTEEPVAEVPTEEPVAEEPIVDEALGFGEFGVSGLDQGLMLASDLMELDINNTADEALGEIEDLLIDVESGNILFALVEHGGFLDIGDEEIAVPLSALEWDANEEDFVLAVSEEAFGNWPEIGDDWPQVDDPAWDDDVILFWEDAGIDFFWDPDTPRTDIAWASNLLGLGIDFEAGTEIGSVEDMIVDVSQSRAKYVLLAFTTGVLGEEFRAVPFSTFDVATLDTGELNMTPQINVDELTAAPALTDEDFGDVLVFSETFDDDLDIYWEAADYPVASD